MNDMKMTQEQFDSLVALMRAIAWQEAMEARGQHVPKDTVPEAESFAKFQFNLQETL